MTPPIEQITKEGYDLQWGTNVVGPFFFAELLMPALLEGVKTSPDQHTRVIATSSSTAYLNTIHWDTFTDGETRRKMGTNLLYAQSKLVCSVSVVCGSHTRQHG